MAIQFQHRFTTTRTADESYKLALALDRLVPCVEGGSVLEDAGEGQVRAQIEIGMGVMSLIFAGAVAVVEQDPDAHRVVIAVESSEVSGEGDANARVEFDLADGGGVIETQAHLTGTAMSMGEGIPTGVLDEMIKHFANAFAALDSRTGA